jgi:hypothetical protein
MKTLRINDSEVAIIAEDGSLNGGARISGAHIVFNQVADAKRVWELLTRDALEYREPEPAVRPADLEMLSKRIDGLEIDVRYEEINEGHNQEDFADLRKEIEDLKQEQQDLRQEFESVQGYAVNKEEVDDIIEDHIRHLDAPDDAHIHDLIAEFIMDDDAGTLRRKVVSIVADKLLGR